MFFENVECRRENDMTLVITEVSEKFGCVVVGDTAVTVNGTDVILGAEKVHYSDTAMIGFAIWGNACLAGRRVDERVAAFVVGLPNTASPRSAGQELAGGSWAVRGQRMVDPGQHFVAACMCAVIKTVFRYSFTFTLGLSFPRLRDRFGFTRIIQTQVPEFTFGMDTTQCLPPSFPAWRNTFKALGNGVSNGHTKNVEDRVSYYSIMVETVAQTLKAAGRLPSVGSAVSALAFNQNGIRVEKRLPRAGEFCKGTNAAASFCEADSNLQRVCPG